MEELELDRRTSYRVMPFPSSERVIYERNPLKEVICDLQFPAILEISSSNPVAFQKVVRKAYPLFSKGTSVHQVNAPPEIPPHVIQLFLSQVGEAGPPTFTFKTADENRAIVMSQSNLVLHEKDYKEWTEFKANFSDVEKTFRKVYEPPFYTRIGLRYVNVIDRDALDLGDSSWSEILKTRLLGLLGGINGVEVTETKTEALLNLNVTSVKGAQAYVRHGLVREQSSGRPLYVLDIDLFTDERSKPTDVPKRLDVFSREAGNFFRHVTRGKLHEALGPRSG
ncbi:MAG: TIGR04255 family protein [Vulcanimicrobiota bacterium]